MLHLQSVQICVQNWNKVFSPLKCHVFPSFILYFDFLFWIRSACDFHRSLLILTWWLVRWSVRPAAPIPFFFPPEKLRTAWVTAPFVPRFLWIYAMQFVFYTNCIDSREKISIGNKMLLVLQLFLHPIVHWSGSLFVPSFEKFIKSFVSSFGEFLATQMNFYFHLFYT